MRPLVYSLATAALLSANLTATAPAGSKWKRCTNRAAGFSVPYPAGWYTTQLRARERCTMFDPRPFRVEPGTEPPLTRLQVWREATTAARVAGSFTDGRFYRGHSEPTRVGRHRGYRFETVANGRGAFLRGTRFYGYALADRAGALVVQTALPPRVSGYAGFTAIVDHAAAGVHFLRTRRRTGAAPTRTVDVYFTNARRQRDANSCLEVFPRSRKVAAGSRPQIVRGALGALLRGPSVSERRAGYRSWFSRRTAGTLNGVRRVRAGVVRVDFAVRLSHVIHGAGSSCGGASLLSSLNATVRSVIPEATSIYSLDGSCRAFSDWLQQVPPPTCPAVRPRTIRGNR